MTDNRNVWLYGEVDEGTLSPVTHELLGIGRSLADTLGGACELVLIDRRAEASAREAVERGADRVHAVTDAPTDHYEGASFATILERLCTREEAPAVLLLGQTPTGRDLAPRVAFRLGSGLVTDCIGLEIDPATRGLIATKPVSGGNVLATYRLGEGRPQMATVRRRAMEPLDRDPGRRGEILPTPAGVDEGAVRVRLVERVRETSEGPSLENADVVVSGGRGIDSPEDFRAHIHGLADLLGGAVGGTRGAVDAGLVSEQHQVGLTGRIVGPNLYFAVGISGAIQHMAGCSASRNIVAINIDENAQIFTFARFGIVGDYRQIVPPLIARLKETL